MRKNPFLLHDCGHPYDYTPKFFDLGNPEDYKTHEFVYNECLSLLEQIKNYVEKDS